MLSKQHRDRSSRREGNCFALHFIHCNNSTWTLMEHHVLESEKFPGTDTNRRNCRKQFLWFLLRQFGGRSGRSCQVVVIKTWSVDKLIVFMLHVNVTHLILPKQPSIVTEHVRVKQHAGNDYRRKLLLCVSLTSAKLCINWKLLRFCCCRCCTELVRIIRQVASLAREITTTANCA